MCLKDTVVVLDNVERESVEGVRRSEPHIPRCTRIEMRLEMLGVLAADGAVDSVGGNDQVGVPKPEATEVLSTADVDTEPKLDTELRCSLLKYLKELLPRDAAESVTT